MGKSNNNAKKKSHEGPKNIFIPIITANPQKLIKLVIFLVWEVGYCSSSQCEQVKELFNVNDFFTTSFQIQDLLQLLHTGTPTSSF